MASHANTWMPAGIDTAMLAAWKNESDRRGMPVANMWWTQRPKASSPVATSDSTTARWPNTGRRENVSVSWLMNPVAGRKMM